MRKKAGCSGRGWLPSWLNCKVPTRVTVCSHSCFPGQGRQHPNKDENKKRRSMAESVKACTAGDSIVYGGAGSQVAFRCVKRENYAIAYCNQRLPPNPHQTSTS